MMGHVGRALLLALRQPMATLCVSLLCSCGDSSNGARAMVDASPLADAASPLDGGGPGCAPVESLANDAREITAECPGSPAVPVQGATVVEGTYHLTRVVAYASGCGALASYPIRATVRIQGDTLDLVWAGPRGFGGGNQNVRASYQFTVAGTVLQLISRCGEDAGARSAVDFAANASHLHISQLPPGTIFDSYLDRR
jgi:hypothetical protein